MWKDGRDVCRSAFFVSTRVLLEPGLGASSGEGGSVLEETSSTCVAYSSSDKIEGLDLGRLVLVPLRKSNPISKNRINEVALNYAYMEG